MRYPQRSRAARTRGRSYLELCSVLLEGDNRATAYCALNWQQNMQAFSPHPRRSRIGLAISAARV